MRRLLVVAVACLLMGGCTTWEGLSPNTQTGAEIGAVSGGILGALLDSNHPWRGAIIGAAAGAAAGGWVGSTTDKKTVSAPVVNSNNAVIDQAAKEAAKQNATVKYSRTTETGINEEVVATPLSLKGNIRTVNIKYYQNGKLVSSETREVSIA
ncbi:MAG: YMGG-like glycine zipper-containing protein [Candidatus Omnitrophica bacterium]|nr:YMGG-like glycine zipper-containing protein [Candidatus Omnitrophota bacterium]